MFQDWQLDGYGWLREAVASIVVLNALDGILTINWIETGKATEANPLMEILISTNPVLFMFIKMLLVCLGAILLWRLRDRVFAVVSIYLCFMVYSLVFFYHLSAFFMLGG